MPPKKGLQRVMLLAVIAATVVALGVGYSMVSVLRGIRSDDSILKANAAQNALDQYHAKDQSSSSSKMTSLKDSSADSNAANPGDDGGPTKKPHAAVWSFTHRGSAPNAVTSVRGIPIEAIHPYLKKKSGGRWIGIHPNDLKISPLLPKMEGSLAPTSKLVFMDLGARMYPGSTGWFLKHYPRSREFNVIVFELLDLEHTYRAAKPYFKSFTYERKAAWTHDGGVAIKGMRMARVDDDVVIQKGDKRPTWLSPSVDVSNYILSNFTMDDFVVLKLDIEGGEWTLIPHLARTGALEYIDEIFFECHPMDFDDYQKEPNRLPAICVDFINDLRMMGAYCHRWF